MTPMEHGPIAIKKIKQLGPYAIPPGELPEAWFYKDDDAVEVHLQCDGSGELMHYVLTLPPLHKKTKG